MPLRNDKLSLPPKHHSQTLQVAGESAQELTSSIVLRPCSRYSFISRAPGGRPLVNQRCVLICSMLMRLEGSATSTRSSISRQSALTLGFCTNGKHCHQPDRVDDSVATTLGLAGQSRATQAAGQSTFCMAVTGKNTFCFSARAHRRECVLCVDDFPGKAGLPGVEGVPAKEDGIPAETNTDA